MSYPGTHESAIADAKKADKQIDGLEPGSTSPVQDGKKITEDGAFQLKIEGKTEFTKERTRHGWYGVTTEPRRELHPIPMKKGEI
jgi:hypothetical protein